VDAMMRTRAIAFVVVVTFAIGGCIGTSPEQQEADALGPDYGRYESGPYHRAGFPCLKCHGDLWWQRGPVMELAGTIYQRSSGDAASRDAAIEITDASGHAFTASTNSAGNFFVVVAGKQPQQYSDGSVEIPWHLDFPLSVRLRGRTRDEDQPMRSHIWKERNCATCHSGNPGVDGNGRIFVEEPSQ